MAHSLARHGPICGGGGGGGGGGDIETRLAAQSGTRWLMRVRLGWGTCPWTFAVVIVVAIHVVPVVPSLPNIALKIVLQSIHQTAPHPHVLRVHTCMLANQASPARRRIIMHYYNGIATAPARRRVARLAS